jgi:hypothetical protein
VGSAHSLRVRYFLLGFSAAVLGLVADWWIAAEGDPLSDSPLVDNYPRTFFCIVLLFIVI